LTYFELNTDNKHFEDISMPTNQLSRIIATTDLGNADTYVGLPGTIFWDTASGSLRVSDGSTAGGLVVGGGSLGLTHGGTIDASNIVAITGNDHVGASFGSNYFSQLFWTDSVSDITAEAMDTGLDNTAFNWVYTDEYGTHISNYPNGNHGGNNGSSSWEFDTHQTLTLPSGYQVHPWIRATDTYPTIIADGVGGIGGTHGGVELDWANRTLTTANFHSNTVLRHTMYLNNDEGLYIGFNENTHAGVGVNPPVSWTFSTDSNVTMPDPNELTQSDTMGYLGLPQVVMSTEPCTLGYADQGHHVYITGGDQDVVIPANSTVAFPIGATIMLVTDGATTATISIEDVDSDSVIQAGTGTTIFSGGNSFVLNPRGMVTLLKIAPTTWMLSGVGLA